MSFQLINFYHALRNLFYNYFIVKKLNLQNPDESRYLFLQIKVERFYLDAYPKSFKIPYIQKAGTFILISPDLERNIHLDPYLRIRVVDTLILILTWNSRGYIDLDPYFKIMVVDTLILILTWKSRVYIERGPNLEIKGIH